eukprot:TRINITY_DN1203_c0_g1_i4.p1 TRINITY_DN1203_c0_g1~~TRINITY_DN1203_c0_g1_i4.p1  ORF type:complete len:105 (-),score=27.53 TRINITY_DN1203_c0_g1_i4:355-669(-)
MSAFWPLIIGGGVACAAIGGKLVIDVVKAMRTRGASTAKRFYEGGFQDKMTRREAALILGCRESSTKDRVLERYRKVMILNHPDRGGSPYIASKINEAKELLHK